MNDVILTLDGLTKIKIKNTDTDSVYKHINDYEFLKT